jgi:prolyl-tRNA synthetase
LLGVPFQLVVGARGLQSGEVELKRSREGTEERLPIDRAVAVVAERVRGELDGYQ